MNRKLVESGLTVKTKSIDTGPLFKSALFIKPHHEDARRADCIGLVGDSIPGTCGEGWWVKHEHGIAGYWFHEFDKVD